MKNVKISMTTIPAKVLFIFFLFIVETFIIYAAVYFTVKWYYFLLEFILAIFFLWVVLSCVCYHIKITDTKIIICSFFKFTIQIKDIKEIRLWGGSNYVLSTNESFEILFHSGKKRQYLGVITARRAFIDVTKRKETKFVVQLLNALVAERKNVSN